jgi:hypothetical protein
MPPEKPSKASSSGKHKRTSSAALNDPSPGLSSKKHKEKHQQKAHRAPKQYVYTVIQATSDPYRPSTWDIRGTYTSLKDANNKVISLWGEPDSPEGREEGQEKGVEEWGGIWWKAEDGEGDFMEAKVERLRVKPESGKVALEWGKGAPGIEQEVHEEEHEEDDEGDGSSASESWSERYSRRARLLFEMIHAQE